MEPEDIGENVSDLNYRDIECERFNAIHPLHPEIECYRIYDNGEIIFMKPLSPNYDIEYGEVAERGMLLSMEMRAKMTSKELEDMAERKFLGLYGEDDEMDAGLLHEAGDATEYCSFSQDSGGEESGEENDAPLEGDSLERTQASKEIKVVALDDTVLENEDAKKVDIDTSGQKKKRHRVRKRHRNGQRLDAEERRFYEPMQPHRAIEQHPFQREPASGAGQVQQCQPPFERFWNFNHRQPTFQPREFVPRPIDRHQAHPFDLFPPPPYQHPHHYLEPRQHLQPEPYFHSNHFQPGPASFQSNPSFQPQQSFPHPHELFQPRYSQPHQPTQPHYPSIRHHPLLPKDRGVENECSSQPQNVKHP